MRRWGAALLLAAAAALLGFWLFPLEAHMAGRRFALRLHGVRRVQAGPLMAYERDACVRDRPCRCVALVHGLGDSALTWDRVLSGDGAPPPPEGTRLLAVDLPGTDGSPEPKDEAGYGVRAQAGALRQALESRCPKWTVAGNSLGGWISLWLALDWPGGVERLVLLGSAGVDDPSGTVEDAARVLSEPTPELMAAFRDKAWHKAPPAPARAWAAAAALIRARPARRIVAQLRREDLLDGRLQSLRTPTAVIWGASDRVVPLSVGRRLQSLIKGSTLQVVEACGHMPQLECPAPVADALYR